MRVLRVFIVVVSLLAASLLLASGTLGNQVGQSSLAEAQSADSSTPNRGPGWEKRRRHKKHRRKRRRKRAKPRSKQRRKKHIEKPAGKPYFDSSDEGSAPSPPADRLDPFAEDAASSDSTTAGSEDTEADDGDTADDSSSDGDTLRFDDSDDTDDVGADVTFTDEELRTDSAEGDEQATQLETLATTFLRMGVDTVHDPVPVSTSGAKAVGEETLSFRANARAEGISRFGKRIKIKVSGWVNADLSLDADTNLAVERYEAEVWDTYADAYWSWIDVRFGKQFVAWGAADILSPNDVVNARDLRRGFLERPEELRLPVLALKATAYDGPFSLQALWVPVAPTNRFELLRGDYALLGANSATPVERQVGALVSTLADDPMLGLQIRPFLDIGEDPNLGIGSGELGMRVGVELGRVDFAGYALWGHERNPRVQLHPQLIDVLVNTPAEMLTPQVLADSIGSLAMMGVSAVSTTYPRRIHSGVSMAGRLEPIGIKLEAAYALETTAVLVPPGGGPLLSTSTALPQVALTASIDYDRGSDLTIILEGSHLQFLDVPDDRDVYQYDHDRQDILATRVDWTPAAGPVTLKLFGIVELGSPSYAVRSAIRLSGHDNLSVEIGATFFGGPQGSVGGIADRNDQVTISVQYGL